jgi:hypothetical protein
MAQYNGKTVVPVDQVCRNFFGHLTVEKSLRKALRGDQSESAARGSSCRLAAYIDHRREAAIKEAINCVVTYAYDASTTNQPEGLAKP